MQFLVSMAAMVVIGFLVFGMKVDRSPVYGTLFLAAVIAAFVFMKWWQALALIFGGTMIGNMSAMGQFRRDIEERDALKKLGEEVDSGHET